MRPAGGGFSFVENVWHLADLEREGYGTRIRRILGEENPALLNFDGDRIARERCYQEKDVERGLALFARARQANLEKLRALSVRGLEALGLAGGRRPRHAGRPAAHDGRARPLARRRDRRPARARPRASPLAERPHPTSAVA